VCDLLISVGARPNFMKAASVVEGARHAGLTWKLVHTGQHYDPELSRVFFDELGLPVPDVSLGIGSASHAVQTARIMIDFEQALQEIRPGIVVVVGDVNSTLACALVAAKERVPVAHVEAGLRCYEQSMPEEINRRLCDHISTYLFTSSRDGDLNLAREGIPADRVHFVGNTMIDTLLRFRPIAASRRFAHQLGVDGRYVVLTLHRAETVDDERLLARVLGGVLEVAERAPVIFPVHPRTRHRIAQTELGTELERSDRIICTPPAGYLDFISLLGDASLVLTDSGGIQEETTVLGVPCLTLRPSTERPVTVACGTNRIVGTDPAAIAREGIAALDAPSTLHRVPELWDGKAGRRIASVLREAIESGRAPVAATA
jgi:UDP-N-acetylglucosamine 2-epimerase (non-hydrolysing)